MQVQGGARGQHRVSRKSKAEVCFKPPKLFSCYQIRKLEPSQIYTPYPKLATNDISCTACKLDNICINQKGQPRATWPKHTRKGIKTVGPFFPHFYNTLP